MVKLMLLVIAAISLQLVGASLDTELQSFLLSTTGKGFAARNVDAVQKLYQLYKKEFNRNSKTDNEEKLRFTLFSESVNALVDNYRQSGKTYTLGLNNFSDWTQDELSKLRSGVQVPQGNISETNMKPGDRLLTWEGKGVQTKAALPASYDLTARVITGTNVPCVLSVRDQGQCGSCYAFALITLLEFQYAVQLKSSASLSEQQIVDCSTYDKGCNGGYFTNTFKYLQNNLWQINGGTYYTYKGVVGRCAFKSSGNGGVRFGSLLYKMVSTNNAAAMQDALVNYGPLWTSLFAGDQSTATYRNISATFNRYKNGVFQPSGCPTSVSSTNHAVVIVGYGVDTTTNLPYWKVRNSWGTSWGENGYFRIKRGVNMCGIESGAYYVGKPA